MTLDLDNLYKTLLGRGPAAYGGGTIQDSARQYWTDEYNRAGGGASGLAAVTSGIKGSQEYKDLGWDAGFDHVANPLASQHRVQAQKSIGRGDGVRAGSVASYSDMFNPDGTQKASWQGIDHWNQNKIEGLQAENAGFQSMFDTLMGNYNTLSGNIKSLQSAYDQQKKDMENMYANANWGYGGMNNPMVKGVKTQTELPGWAPKKGGTRGFFGRGGGSMGGLTTSSLNLA